MLWEGLWEGEGRGHDKVASNIEILRRSIQWRPSDIVVIFNFFSFTVGPNKYNPQVFLASWTKTKLHLDNIIKTGSLSKSM